MCTVCIPLEDKYFYVTKSAMRCLFQEMVARCRLNIGVYVRVRMEKRKHEVDLRPLVDYLMTMVHFKYWRICCVAFPGGKFKVNCLKFPKCDN